MIWHTSRCATVVAGDAGDQARWDGGMGCQQRLRLALGTVVLLASLFSGAPAAQTVSHPFPGVTLIDRTDTSPRPVRLHVVEIDLRTPGLRFRVTPPGGQLDTLKQTTMQFLTEQKAQLVVNGHFFEPWPAPQPDPGEADLVGLAASDGTIYSPFESAPPKPHAIRANAPALNIDRQNRAAIVHRNPADLAGRSILEPVELYNTVAGNEQVLTSGEVTAGTGQWDNRPNPLTVIGLAGPDKLVLLVVDGRQPGQSEGLSVREAAELLRRDYDVTDALNLDGGGSSALCLADPTARIVNVPVGIKDTPGTLRPVGSNLAIFVTTPPPSALALPVRFARMPLWLALIGLAAGALIVTFVFLARRRWH